MPWPGDLQASIDAAVAEAKTRPWEKHIKEEDRPAARELFKQVRPWNPRVDVPPKVPLGEQAVANVARMISVTPGFDQLRAQKLQEFDDRIRHAWDEAVDNSAFNKVQADAFPQWKENVVGPIEREKAAWEASNPPGLHPAHQAELLAKLQSPSSWSERGTFETKDGRYTVQMQVANAVPMGDGGTMTSSLDSRVGSANGAGTADTRAKESGWNAGFKTDILGGEASAGYTSKESSTHTDTRSRTDDQAGAWRNQVAGPSEVQQVTMRATIVDNASGARVDVNLDRVTIKTEK